MNVSRPRTEKQLRHPGSRSLSHKKDKAEGEARQAVKHIPVPAGPSSSPKRNLAGLEPFEMQYVGPFRWRRLTGPDDLGDLLVAEEKKRRYYVTETTRHGHPEVMKRTDPCSLAVLTFTLHPAAADFLAAEIAAGRNPMPKLKEIVELFLTKIERMMQGRRYLIAMALHVDTDDPHIDVVVSRNGPDGRLGMTGFRTLGPWGCGVYRQIKSGAAIGSGKRAMFERAMANFSRRYPEMPEPFDIELVRHLDLYSRAVIGAEVFDPFVRDYAGRVPALERAHAKRQLAQLEAAKQ
jgi:hypothetical protein